MKHSEYFTNVIYHYYYYYSLSQEKATWRCFGWQSQLSSDFTSAQPKCHTCKWGNLQTIPIPSRGPRYQGTKTSHPVLACPNSRSIESCTPHNSCFMSLMKTCWCDWICSNRQQAKQWWEMPFGLEIQSVGTGKLLKFWEQVNRGLKEVEPWGSHTEVSEVQIPSLVFRAGSGCPLSNARLMPEGLMDEAPSLFLWNHLLHLLVCVHVL